MVLGLTCCGHEVLVRVLVNDAQEIERVQQEELVLSRQVANQPLVLADLGVGVQRLVCLNRTELHRLARATADTGLPVRKTQTESLVRGDS